MAPVNPRGQVAATVEASPLARRALGDSAPYQGAHAPCSPVHQISIFFSGARKISGLLGSSFFGRSPGFASFGGTSCGGSGCGNYGGVHAFAIPSHGFDNHAVVTLPPLGVVFLKKYGDYK